MNTHTHLNLLLLHCGLSELAKAVTMVYLASQSSWFLWLAHLTSTHHQTHLSPPGQGWHCLGSVLISPPQRQGPWSASTGWHRPWVCCGHTPSPWAAPALGCQSWKWLARQSVSREGSNLFAYSYTRPAVPYGVAGRPSHTHTHAQIHIIYTPISVRPWWRSSLVPQTPKLQADMWQLYEYQAHLHTSTCQPYP